MIPTDLKDWKAPKDGDAFLLISPDLAIFLLVCIFFAGYVFRGFL